MLKSRRRRRYVLKHFDDVNLGYWNFSIKVSKSNNKYIEYVSRLEIEREISNQCIFIEFDIIFFVVIHYLSIFQWHCVSHCANWDWTHRTQANTQTNAQNIYLYLRSLSIANIYFINRFIDSYPRCTH